MWCFLFHILVEGQCEVACREHAATSPIRYLASWRMQLAKQLMREGTRIQGVATAAQDNWSPGYEDIPSIPP